MPEGGTGDRDILRLWLEGSRAFLNANVDAARLWPQCQQMFATWSRVASKMAGGAGAARAGDHDGEHPFDPVGWMRAEGQGRMADLWRWLEGPDFAGILDEHRRVLRESREWMAYVTALEQMQAVTAAGWMQAFRRFIDMLSRKMEAARDSDTEDPDWETMRVLWREIADVELAEMQRSDDYLTAQRELIRTQVDLRQVLRERIEEFADMLGLPTRAEIDDLHRAVDELRREAVALRQGGNTGRGGA